MILIEGLSNYQGAKFDGLEELSQAKREERYIKKVENIVRSLILGSYGSEAQWSLPVNKVSTGEESLSQIGTISMENYKARKCVNMIYLLIDVSIPDRERKENYNLVLGTTLK